MTDRGIRLKKDGIYLRTRKFPLLSGSCHYWRHDRSKWQLIIDQFVDLGFPIIQTYVPWSVHETAQGQFDFGKYSPNKDLKIFLEMCGEAGLFVFLRPGPHINAEITYFGYPKRLFDNPENLAVSATGGQVTLPVPPKTFPLISYASEHFFKELELWFDAFAEAAASYCHPDGPVIGIQADNEMSFFFRTATYDQDYSQWAHAMYHQFLTEKYGTLENIREAYDRALSSVNELKMPTSFNGREARDLPYYMDYTHFKEELLHKPLDRIIGMLNQRGFDGLLTFHNYPLNKLHTPFNISRGEKTFDFVGVDFYQQKTDYTLFRKRLLALAGTSRFPMSPEFSSGCYQAWAPIDLSDQRFSTYLALALGLRGFNFYMIVERERWYGSPITRNGELRENYAEFYKEVLNFIDESELFTMDRVAEVLLLRSRDYDRLEKCTDILSPIPPIPFEDKLGAPERCIEDTFGFEYPVQIDHDVQFDRWYDLLTRAKIPFNVSDTDLDPLMLPQYKVVVMPTFDFLSRATQQLLESYVVKGGILICGPDIPSMDEWMNRFSTLDRFTSRPVHKLECSPDTFVFNAGAGRIVLVNGIIKEADAGAELMAHVAKMVHINQVFPATGPCETSTFTGPGDRTLVFVINPTDQPRRPRIHTGGGLRFRDLLNNDEYHGGSYILVDMEPYSVRPMEVRADA